MPVRNFILLLLTALIWGTAFVGQSVGLEHVPPFTFTAGRSLLGGLCLIPVILAADGLRPPAEKRFTAQPDIRRNSVIGGIVCGTLLFIAESLQQFGLLYTSVGKAGFITALYIIIVPMLAGLAGSKNSLRIWAAALIATAGLYLLSVKGDFSVGPGDLLCLSCALGYSCQILAVGRYAAKVDPIRMSCVMFFTGAVLGTALTLLLEAGVTLQAIAEALPAMLYVGILSNGVAYTLQVLAQRDANPTIASLIMSLESVFAALAGWIILGQTLSGREILGCCLMAVAIVLAQLPQRRTTVPAHNA